MKNASIKQHSRKNASMVLTTKGSKELESLKKIDIIKMDNDESAKIRRPI